MMSFLRLVRFLNLFIVFLTILGVTFFHSKVNGIEIFELINFDYFVFIISVILITASGNIINDYFDVKADQINKPNRLIISKKIKRRWAIVLHLSFNTIAFLISLYLSFKYKNFLLFLLPFLAINILWTYSWYLKKKLLIGNFAVAFLTALVPLLTVIYLDKFIPFKGNELKFIFFISTLAFLQNFIREIVKDTEDIEGDKLIYVKSLPLAFGKKVTKIVCICLLTILPLVLIFSLLNIESELITPQYILIFSSIWISGFLNVLLIILIIFQDFGRLKLYNNLLKVSLIIGLSSLFIIPTIYESTLFRIFFAS